MLFLVGLNCRLRNTGKCWIQDPRNFEVYRLGGANLPGCVVAGSFVDRHTSLSYVIFIALISGHGGPSRRTIGPRRTRVSAAAYRRGPSWDACRTDYSRHDQDGSREPVVLNTQLDAGGGFWQRCAAAQKFRSPRSPQFLDQALISYRYSSCCCCSCFSWDNCLQKSLRLDPSFRIGTR